LNDLLPFAEKLLSEHGEFFPFAGAMKSDGEIVWLSARDGREQPPSQDIIDLLVDQLRAGALKGIYDASALVYDVRLPNRTPHDAVLVSLDHRSGLSAEMLYPYTIYGGPCIFATGFGRRTVDVSSSRRTTFGEIEPQPIERD